MKSVALADLLTNDQCEEVRQILLAETDQLKVTERLKALFVPLRAQLEAKGVLPEYLAYAVTYALQAQREANQN